MQRQPLIYLLQCYVPSHEEAVTKDRMIAFIMQHSDCFERSLSVGHVTASAWLLNNDQSKALLMHHTKLDKWVQLGGHCDGDPDVLSVAIKEAQEESGIKSIVPISSDIFDIDIHLIPENKHEKEHYHYDVRFLLQVTSDAIVTKNSESKALRWVGKNRDELPTDHRSVMRMFNKWVQQQPDI